MLVSRVKHRVIMDKDEINEGNTVSSSPASHSPASQVLVGVASSSSSPSLHDMSSLSQHLPLKRGLSEYYKGKSQSFTSLSNVRCLEDLAKPENPYKKKLKSCKSYGGGLLMEEANEETYNYKLSFPKPLHPRILSKTPPRKCCSQMNLNANKRPPIPIPILIPIPVPVPVPVPPHTSPTSNRISNQTPLFA